MKVWAIENEIFNIVEVTLQMNFVTGLKQYRMKQSIKITVTVDIYIFFFLFLFVIFFLYIASCFFKRL